MIRSRKTRRELSWFEPNRAQAGLLHAALELEELGRQLSRAASRSGISDSQFRVLLALLDSPWSQAQLQATLVMDSGLVTRTVAALRTKGLIASNCSGPRPKTGFPLRLTEEGHDEATHAKLMHRQALEEILTQEDAVKLARILGAMSDAKPLQFEINQGPYVRPACLGDIGTILQISGTDTPIAFERVLTRMEQYAAETFLEFKWAPAQSATFLIGELWGKVAGGILVLTDKNTDEGLIALLVVKNLYRGRKVGTALVTRACEIMRSYGKAKVVGLSLPDDDGESLFKALGWIKRSSLVSDRLGPSLEFEVYEHALGETST